MHVLFVAGKVTGVAYLKDVMYVVSENLSLVHLYDTETYNLLERVIEVTEMTHPTDIAACHDDDQLLIADSGEGSPCIWQVSVRDDSHAKLLPNANTPTISAFETLSVTSRRLLLTLPRALQQYSTTDGRLICEVPSPKNLQLCHSIETARETFIVSYRTEMWQYEVNESYSIKIENLFQDNVYADVHCGAVSLMSCDSFNA